METNKPDTNNNIFSATPKVDRKQFVPKTEEERLREDIYRSDMEKLHLFTRMLRRNAMFKNAKITHK
jgi:hypothetical protein